MVLFPIPWPEIPACAWQRPLGRGGAEPASREAGAGMPLGGFGAGCLGRSPRGDFNHWHLDSGEPIEQSLPACQFAIFEQPEGGPAQAYALCTTPPADGSLSRWRWYPAEQGHYAALYPRSWYCYQGVFAADLICEQFSPIWAQCYQESSYPIAVFEWTVRNPTDQPLTLSLLLSWQNTVGWFTNARAGATSEVPYQAKWGDSTGNFNQWIVDRHRVGFLFNRVRLYDELHPGEGQMAIASVSNPAVENFYLGRWNPLSDGGDVWDWFARDGTLPDKEDETPADPGEQIAAAMALRFTLRPGRTRKIPFYLAWDFPVMAVAPGVTNFRRHSDFFARTGNNAWTMVRTAMKHSDVWKEKIEQWQAPIIQQPDWPDWFKLALCNALYLLADGGTLWTAATETAPVGQFAMLASGDEPRYESLAVRHYGSWALLQLWPRLDKAVLEAFARAIQRAEGAYPSDLGAPRAQPWEQAGAGNTAGDRQLDAGSTFIIQVYRDFLLTGARDTDFLWECWPAIAAILAQPPTAPTASRWGATAAGLAIAEYLAESPPSDPALLPSDYPASLETAIATYRDRLQASSRVALTLTPAERDRFAHALELTAAVTQATATEPAEIAAQLGRAADLARHGDLESAWSLAEAIVQPIYQSDRPFCSPGAIAADGRCVGRHSLAVLALWTLYGALTDTNPVPDSD